MCSVWYLECLSRSGDLQKAAVLLRENARLREHLGLYGEEPGPRAQHLGNFPQAFTHVALSAPTSTSIDVCPPPARPAESVQNDRAVPLLSRPRAR